MSFIPIEYTPVAETGPWGSVSFRGRSSVREASANIGSCTWSETECVDYRNQFSYVCGAHANINSYRWGRSGTVDNPTHDAQSVWNTRRPTWPSVSSLVFSVKNSYEDLRPVDRPHRLRAPRSYRLLSNAMAWASIPLKADTPTIRPRSDVCPRRRPPSQPRVRWCRKRGRCFCRGLLRRG